MNKPHVVAGQPLIEALEARLLFSATMDVVLVDSQLEDQELLKAAAFDVDNYIVFDSERDSAQSIINEVTRWADEQNQTIDSLSIFSHGREGAFQLGTDTITNDSVSDQSFDLWGQLGQAFSEQANVFIYGCNVAGDGSGQALINSIAQSSGANVFASDDISGAGGDWDLEVASQSSDLSPSALLSPIDTSKLEAYSGSLPDTGWLAPSAVGETTGQWDDPLNAQSSDNNRTDAAFGEVQDYRNFGVDLSSVTNTVIGGIEVNIEAYTVAVTPGLTVQLSWDGGSSWTEGRSLSWDAAFGDVDQVAGSTTDTWGRVWAADELNDDNFRVRVINTDAYILGGENLEIDSLQLKAHFTGDPVAPNTAPIATAVMVSDSEDVNSVTLTLSGTDVDGTINQFRLASLPANGTLYTDAGLTIAAVANVDYPATVGVANFYFQPDADWNGSTEFQYFTLDDDAAISAASATAQIIVLAENDVPVIVGNALTINEGQAVQLSSADIVVTDVDNALIDISITVSSVVNGQFELVATPGSAITSFTYNQLASNAIQFVHNGGEAAPSYDVTVFDGEDFSSVLSADIIFTANVDDASLLVNNSLTINEGQSVLLTTSQLLATDSDTANSNIQILVSGVSQGQFELVSNPGAAITGFSQQQVIDGAVRFVHDGGEVAPSYNIQINDGTTLSAAEAATISFIANIDDASVLVNNSLTINEGQSVLLTTSQLLATDSDTANSNIQILVSGVSQGQFELVSNPGAAITGFSQQQVIDGAVRFVHDGGEVAPSYNIQINDGTTLSAAEAATISFLANVNDAPIAGNIEEQLLSKNFQSFTIDLTTLFSDVDGVVEQLRFSIEGNQQTAISVDANGLATVLSSSLDWGETEVISFVAEDTSGATAVLAVNFTMQPAASVLNALQLGEQLESNNIITESELQNNQAESSVAVVESTANEQADENISNTIAGTAAEPNNDANSQANIATGIDTESVTPALNSLQLHDFLAVSDVVREIESLSFSAVIEFDNNNETASTSGVVSTIKTLQKNLSNDLFSPGFLKQWGGLGWLPSNNQFWHELDDLGRDVDEQYEVEEKVQQGVKGVGAISLSVVGAWFLRAAALGSSMFASIPMWRTVDPVVVLNKVNQADEQQQDDDDVEPMFSSSSAR